jgi:MFS family permease
MRGVKQHVGSHRRAYDMWRWRCRDVFGVLTLLSALTSIQERPLYIGFTGLIWGIGTVIGPALGRSFSVRSPTWRVRLLYKPVPGSGPRTGLFLSHSIN